MQPMGRKKIRFPCKTKEWFGKGILMWWENVVKLSKKRERQIAKKKIKDSI